MRKARTFSKCLLQERWSARGVIRGNSREKLLDGQLWPLDCQIRQFQQGKGCGQAIIKIVEQQMRNCTAIETRAIFIHALIIGMRAFDVR